MPCIVSVGSCDRNGVLHFSHHNFAVHASQALPAICCSYRSLLPAIQEVQEQMTSKKQALATKLAELQSQNADLRQKYCQDVGSG